MNLQQTIDHLFKLYGHKNAVYLRGDMRAMYLHRAVKSLCQAIRKLQPEPVIGKILASLFARSVSYADSFVDLPLVEALCTKYPFCGCAYCQSNPCKCESKRTDSFKEIEIDVSEQMEWTITDWVEYLDGVYGENNRERGINHALLRLIEEMHEAESAHLFDRDDYNSSLKVQRKSISMEFADLFAWIFSVAGMLNVDLEKYVEERYGSGCRRCGQVPCDCIDPVFYRKRSNPIFADTTAI